MPPIGVAQKNLIIKLTMNSEVNGRGVMSVFRAEDSTKSSPDRVRKSTAVQVNAAIDYQTDLNIHLYKDKSQAETL